MASRGGSLLTSAEDLSYYLIHHSILPIRITCGRSFPDSAGFADNFYLKLRNELRRELAKMSQETETFLSDLDLEAQILELARRITPTRERGIIIFMDDYHKHRPRFSIIYEFLGLLQILKDALTRARLNVGFIVSGTSDWKLELSTNGQMSGFLDSRPIEMPETTPELVCDVFNQRIRAFCYDQSPRKLKLDFVRRISREVAGKTGYREYLNRIVQELSSNNLSIVDTPIEIAEGTLQQIKALIQADPALHASLNKLLYQSKFQKFTKEQIAKCLELLVQTTIHEGVGEDDRLFTDNKFYFQLLRDVMLIQKRRVAVPDGAGSLRWGIHTRLQRVVDGVWKQYQLRPCGYPLDSSDPNM